MPGRGRQHLEMEKEASAMRQRLDRAADTEADLQHSRLEAARLQEELHRLQEVTADQEAAAAAEQELRARVRLAPVPLCPPVKDASVCMLRARISGPATGSVAACAFLELSEHADIARSCGVAHKLDFRCMCAGRLLLNCSLWTAWYAAQMLARCPGPSCRHSSQFLLTLLPNAAG